MPPPPLWGSSWGRMRGCKVVGGIERRGRVYHLRLRTPARFRRVEPRLEVTLSLRTDSLIEARARHALAHQALHRAWETRLRGQDAPTPRAAWAESTTVLVGRIDPQLRVEHQIGAPVQDLLARLERLAERVEEPVPPPALPGGAHLPRILVSEMPAHHERVRADRVSAKNPRQMREWRNKYLRATEAFVAAVGDKPVAEVTAADARAYRIHWEKKRTADGITTEYVNKQIGYMKQLVDSYCKDAGLLPADYTNAFGGLALEKLGTELRQEEGRKLALPAAWIRDVLLDPARTAGLNAEARDIAVVCAETGARAAEIVDLSPEDIVIDHEIPHLRILIVEEGEHRRELKNTSSKRPIPLLGHALNAMRRHPSGFPRYRGKATYSNAINKYLREGKLFPPPPKGSDRAHSIGGARHAYEDRMKHAGISNEERAVMMGHSLKALRGRPVYGAITELRIRALLAEKAAFPTPTWTPRPHEELDAEVDRLLTTAGFRRR
jgi:integrase